MGLLHAILRIGQKAEVVVSAEARREGDATPLTLTIDAGRILVDAIPSPSPVAVTWRTK
jgi:hypothetical protein